jgi:hypothetical protein
VKLRESATLFCQINLTSRKRASLQVFFATVFCLGILSFERVDKNVGTVPARRQFPPLVREYDPAIGGESDAAAMPATQGAEPGQRWETGPCSLLDGHNCSQLLPLLEWCLSIQNEQEAGRPDRLPLHPHSPVHCGVRGSVVYSIHPGPWPETESRVFAMGWG